MVNIWEYAYADNVRVVCTTGETFEGNVIDMVDSDEDEDMTEDELAVETRDGTIYGLKQSEIASIEKIQG